MVSKNDIVKKNKKKGGKKNKMELRTNCKNCGAPLEYDRTKYGKTTKCKYCRTEYHIDLLGRVEEYKVKLEIMGEIREFYIGEIEVCPIWDGFESVRSLDGRMCRSIPRRNEIKLSLISY